jgi:hypothetical protein
VTRRLKFLIPILVLSTSCLAQEALTIRTHGKQKPPADAQKIYLSAYSAVQREFGTYRVPRPKSRSSSEATPTRQIGIIEKSTLRNGTPTSSPKVW